MIAAASECEERRAGRRDPLAPDTVLRDPARPAAAPRTSSLASLAWHRATVAPRIPPLLEARRLGSAAAAAFPSTVAVAGAPMPHIRELRVRLHAAGANLEVCTAMDDDCDGLLSAADFSRLVRALGLRLPRPVVGTARAAGPSRPALAGRVGMTARGAPPVSTHTHSPCPPGRLRRCSSDLSARTNATASSPGGPCWRPWSARLGREAGRPAWRAPRPRSLPRRRPVRQRPATAAGWARGFRSP